MSKKNILIGVGVLFALWIAFELFKSPVTSKKEEKKETELPKINVESNETISTGTVTIFGKEYPIQKPTTPV